MCVCVCVCVVVCVCDCMVAHKREHVSVAIDCGCVIDVYVRNRGNIFVYVCVVMHGYVFTRTGICVPVEVVRRQMWSMKSTHKKGSERERE